MNITVLAGNPKPGSRTLDAAVELGGLLGQKPPRAIDLADHAAELVRWGDPVIAGLRAEILGSDLVIVASPTFKASFTGLLKMFLDGFSQGEWGGLRTVPLMTGASAHHALAPEVQLKPVLTELGASMPTPSLYLVMNEKVSERLEAWHREFASRLLDRA